MLHTLILWFDSLTRRLVSWRQNIAGFLYVKDVELAERTLVCLAPAAGNLPGRLLLGGSFKVYFD